MWFNILKSSWKGKKNIKVHQRPTATLITDYLDTINIGDEFRLLDIVKLGKEQIDLYLSSEGEEGVDYRYKKIVRSGRDPLTGEFYPPKISPAPQSNQISPLLDDYFKGEIEMVRFEHVPSKRKRKVYRKVK